MKQIVNRFAILALCILTLGATTTFFAMQESNNEEQPLIIVEGEKDFNELDYLKSLESKTQENIIDNYHKIVLPKTMQVFDTVSDFNKTTKEKITAIKELITEGARINHYVSKIGRNPIVSHAILYDSDIELIEFLVNECDADIHYSQDPSRSPLTKALNQNKEHIIKFICDHKKFCLGKNEYIFLLHYYMLYYPEKRNLITSIFKKINTQTSNINIDFSTFDSTTLVLYSEHLPTLLMDETFLQLVSKNGIRKCFIAPLLNNDERIQKFDQKNLENYNTYFKPQSYTWNTKPTCKKTTSQTKLFERIQFLIDVLNQFDDEFRGRKNPGSYSSKNPSIIQLFKTQETFDASITQAIMHVLDELMLDTEKTVDLVNEIVAYILKNNVFTLDDEEKLFNHTIFNWYLSNLNITQDAQTLYNLHIMARVNNLAAKMLTNCLENIKQDTKQPESLAKVLHLIYRDTINDTLNIDAPYNFNKIRCINSLTQIYPSLYQRFCDDCLHGTDKYIIWNYDSFNLLASMLTLNFPTNQKELADLQVAKIKDGKLRNFVIAGYLTQLHNIVSPDVARIILSYVGPDIGLTPKTIKKDYTSDDLEKAILAIENKNNSQK